MTLDEWLAAGAPGYPCPDLAEQMAELARTLPRLQEERRLAELEEAVSQQIMKAAKRTAFARQEIHHKDGDPRNSALDNLELRPAPVRQEEEADDD